MGKKILVLCTTDSMIWNFLVPHIKDMKAKGNVVECACSETGFFFDALGEQGIVMHRINFDRSPYSLKNIKHYFDLKKLLNTGGYELIYCHEPVGGAMGRLAGRALKKKVIYIAHGFHFYKGAPFINNLIYKNVERFLAHFTDVLVTINREDYEAACSFRLKKEGEVFLIPGIGVDTTRIKEKKVNCEQKRAELGIAQDAIVVLTIAELIKRKNYDTALKAFAAANIPDSVYLICGTGVLTEELKELAVQLGIEGNIIFAGFRSDIDEIVHLADIFLFATHQEGLGIGALEGMCAGLPVIASNVRGVTEFCENGKTGFLCNHNDITAFAKALDTLVKAPKLRAQIGEHNRLVAEQFSIQISITALGCIYREMQCLDYDEKEENYAYN